MNISKSTLLEVTRRLRSLPPTNSSLPVLSCVRIFRTAAGTTFAATDLEVFLSVTVPVTEVTGPLGKLGALRAARESIDILVPSSTLDRCAKAADKGSVLDIIPDAKGGAQIAYTQSGSRGRRTRKNSTS